MNSIGGYERIIEGQGSFHSFCNGLLSGIEVAESSNFLLLVEGVACEFHFPHDEEFFVVFEEVISGDGGGLGDGMLIEFVGLDRGLHRRRSTS